MSSDFAPEPADKIDATIEILVSNPDVDFHPSVQTLSRLLVNVLKNPSDPKYRRVPLSSQAFQTKVLGVKGGRAFLESMGWVQEGDAFVFPNSADLVHLEMGRQLLDQSTQRHEEYKRTMKAQQQRKEKEKEERTRDVIMSRVSAAQREVSTKENRASHSRLKGGPPNISNFKECGIDLNKGGG